MGLILTLNIKGNISFHVNADLLLWLYIIKWGRLIPCRTWLMEVLSSAPLLPGKLKWKLMILDEIEFISGEINLKMENFLDMESLKIPKIDTVFQKNGLSDG